MASSTKTKKKEKWGENSNSSKIVFIVFIIIHFWHLHAYFWLYVVALFNCNIEKYACEWNGISQKKCILWYFDTSQHPTFYVSMKMFSIFIVERTIMCPALGKKYWNVAWLCMYWYCMLNLVFFFWNVKCMLLCYRADAMDGNKFMPYI